jgi:hypothetical protein
MTYRPSRRHWVKLWVNEHLDGSLRLDLTAAEQSVWVDLLALAGISRWPGTIAAALEEDGYRGYPIKWLAERFHKSQKLVLSTITKCEAHGRLIITRQQEETQPEGSAIPGGWHEASVLKLANWEKYQSEYQRKAAAKSGQNVKHFKVCPECQYLVEISKTTALMEICPLCMKKGKEVPLVKQER